MAGALNTRELSPEAQAAAAWFRQLARALKVFRLYSGTNPFVAEAQENLARALAQLVAAHGPWELRFAATEIFLGEESLVRAVERQPGGDVVPSVTDQLPFLFYRDGIRKMRLLPGVPRHEIDALIDGLKLVSHGANTQDDLVTWLWQANLTGILLEAVPLEQTIYLSSRPGGGHAGDGDRRGQTFAWSPTGSEIRADLGQVASGQGLHRDTFDDWELPEPGTDVSAAYQILLPAMEAARPRFLAGWEAERSVNWDRQVPEFVRALLTLDPGEDTRRALAHALVTWVASAIENVAWSEAQVALRVLDALDPDRTLSAEDMTAALAGIDTGALAEALDEGDTAEHGRFTAITVALGKPAVGFTAAVMSRATKARSRAATCTALCYLCADEPMALAPWISDSRWHVVRNVVFVLGHIGGPEVVPLLQAVSRHPEPRVRRQLVHSLGSVPPEERIPILIGQLDSRDPQVLAAALNMLTREKDARVARAILDCIEATDFESRAEGNQRALFSALGEVADDGAVPALETLLNRGGWFARRSFQRSVAARTLARINSEKAVAVLEAGLRARSEAVRSACIEALGSRGRS